MHDIQIEQNENQLDAKEALDREGYLRQPQAQNELQLWEAEAEWPEK